MAEVTEQEAREAADVSESSSMAVAAAIEHGTHATVECVLDVEMLDRSCSTLREFVLQELSRRDAEQAERALPITAEWCLANGAEWSNYRSAAIWYVPNGQVEWSSNVAVGTRVACGLCRVPMDHIRTCGQLIDLVNGLKGGAS